MYNKPVNCNFVYQKTNTFILFHFKFFILFFLFQNVKDKHIKNAWIYVEKNFWDGVPLTLTLFL